MHKVESVTRGSKGALVISGRTGAREIAVEIPKTEINALLAGSRWPLKPKSQRRAKDRPPDQQLSLL
jgi:hypothetical protein